ncbi:MAG: hypothetical protein AABX80_00745, partial [Nanoarchaeota archaeon]
MKRGNKGAMELSFGMIFSIILIIIFIAFAIYGIGKFLNLQKNIQTKTFVNNLNFDIDKLWKANSGSQPVTYSLPGNVEEVCFSEFENNVEIEIKTKKGFGGNYNIIHAEFSKEGKGSNCVPVEN